MAIFLLLTTQIIPIPYQQLLSLILFLLPLFCYSQESTKPTDSVLVSQQATSQAGAIKEYNEAYFVLTELNQGLPASDTVPNLQTPQATMEYFVLRGREKDYQKAAQVLNLNLIPGAQQSQAAAKLVQQLFYLLNNELGIDWDVLPDRPDGLISIPNTNVGTKKLVGQPRRSVLLGSLSYQDRELPIRLQRVKVKHHSPVWVFSPSTAENIGLMYEVYGPSRLAQWLPEWTEFSILNMPLWKWWIFIVITVISYLIARLGYGMARRLSRKANDECTTAIMNSIATPVAFLFGIGVFLLISSLSQTYIGPVSSYFNGVLWIAIVIAFTWLIMRVISYFSNYLAKKHTAEHKEDDEKVNRTYLTYISVAHRALVFLVVIIGLAVILTQFRPM